MIPSETAVRRRDRDPQQTLARGRSDQIRGIAARLIDFGGARCDVLAREAVHRRPERFLFGCELEVHCFGLRPMAAGLQRALDPRPLHAKAARRPAATAPRSGPLLPADADVADDRHEVGVAGPARHEMQVHVVGDAGAGRPAEIHPDVDALGLIDLAQRNLAALRQEHHLRQLVRRQRRERRDMAVRHDHQVAAVVRIQIEDDERVPAAIDDQLFFLAQVRAAEDARVLVIRARSRRRASRATRGVP